jgi:hypothetical protein
MSGWTILIRAVVCAVGVLMFLTLVAHELGRVGVRLEHLRRREKRTWERRRRIAEGGLQLDPDGVYRAEVL